MSRGLFTVSRLCCVLITSLLFACSSGDDSARLRASIDADRISSQTVPFTVRFSAEGSTGNIQNYIWDFGDNSGTALGETTTHTFSEFGVYTVSLSVNDGNETVTSSVVVSATASISGTITAQAGAIQDSDVNDPNAPFDTNDDPSTAQLIANPVIVGGYASAAGTGIGNDRFSDSGDMFDVYRVTLGANQTIRLSVSDATDGNNLDLYLFENDRISLFNSSCANPLSPVASSTNDFPDKTESLAVPQDGEYFIAVCAMEGWSNYVLTVGNTTVLNITSIDEQDEFIPGEVIVSFKEDNTLAPALRSLQARAGSLGLNAKGGVAGGPMLFAVGDEAQRRQAFTRLGIVQPKWATRSGSDAEKLKQDTFSILRALRQRSDVKSADLNYIRKPLATPSDPRFADQWHYTDIGLPSAWDAVIADRDNNPDTAVNASSVIVAVVDTGVIMAHEDLTANLVDGYDFISSPQNSNDGDGRDANPDDPGGDAPVGSSSFHGSHVAGTIAATTDNGIGVAGVVWNTNTRVMPIRVLGVNGGTSFDILEGMRYAVGMDNSEETSVETAARVTAGNIAQIINLSLGGGSFSQTEQNLFTEIRNAGVIIVAASGNSGTDTLSYPASYDGVVSVGAVTRTPASPPGTPPQLASYSNTGPLIDLVAPGGDGNLQNPQDNVLSTSGDDSSGAVVPGYRFLRGTSMAAPHVAGVVALMKSVYPGLTPDELDILIQSGVLTDDLSNDGASIRNDDFGYGLINALKAVQQALILHSGGDLPPFLSVNPSLINFLEPETAITMNTGNPGGGSVQIDSITVNVPWLSVTASGVDASNLGDYSVTVNRAGLANAQYQATIVLDYTVTGNESGRINIPVSLQVGPLNMTGDTGYQYAILADFDLMLQSPVVDPTVDVIELGNPVNGVYSYRFDDLVEGNYVVLAGSDNDNDFSLCDAGEACGLFPSLISINGQGITGANFTSRFDEGISATGVQDISGYPRSGTSIPNLPRILTDRPDRNRHFRAVDTRQ